MVDSLNFNNSEISLHSSECSRAPGGRETRKIFDQNGSIIVSGGGMLATLAVFRLVRRCVRLSWEPANTGRDRERRPHTALGYEQIDAVTAERTCILSWRVVRPTASDGANTRDVVPLCVACQRTAQVHLAGEGAFKSMSV